MRLLLFLCCVLMAVGLAPLASAQGAGPTRLVVSPRRVEVGEAFSVELAVQASPNNSPSDASLELPDDVQLRSGPSIGSSTNIQLGPGGLQRSHSVSLTWIVVASKPGKYSIGPGGFEIGGKRVEGSAASVEVLKAGTRPRRRRNDPFSGFPDPFGRRGRMPDFPSLRPLDTPLAPPAPEAAHVEHAPDARAFLRIVATPERAVVGQQVRVRVFAYGQGGNRGNYS